MKITRRQLRRIIKEEKIRFLKEYSGSIPDRAEVAELLFEWRNAMQNLLNDIELGNIESPEVGGLAEHEIDPITTALAGALDALHPVADGFLD